MVRRDPRSQEQIREHYLVERALGDRLRRAGAEERRALYSAVYTEMYARVPLHPQLVRQVSAEETARTVARQMAFLSRFLRKEATFLEIGPGDGALAFEAARSARLVYAVDVSDQITRTRSTPGNFELVLSDGASIPVPEGSVDVAYSNQLLEHLHPDDAGSHLREVRRALRPGGVYVCLTPNALSGPHDVSSFFDEVATGFHLKEYTNRELRPLFRAAGFSQVRSLAGAGRRFVALPAALVDRCEGLLSALPHRLRRALASRLPLRPVLGIRMVGRR